MTEHASSRDEGAGAPMSQRIPFGGEGRGAPTSQRTLSGGEERGALMSQRTGLRVGEPPRGNARWPWLVLALLGAFCLAPTPGDIGGCGQPAQPLDPTIFYDSLYATDCRACEKCGFMTMACKAACAPPGGPQSFPLGCEPVAHDGEVCLRVLQSTSCHDYASYVSDSAPTRPSECQFCPR